MAADFIHHVAFQALLIPEETLYTNKKMLWRYNLSSLSSISMSLSPLPERHNK